MGRVIVGNTTATPYPRPDWSQTDENRADFIKNKPTVLSESDVIQLIRDNGGGGGGSPINQVQSDWAQTDETKVDYIKNKPTITNGVDGKSAYEIALDKGFEGTEEEWLESLKSDVDVSDVLRYTEQDLTDDQRAQARTNIGAGTSSFSGSYYDLTDKPVVRKIIQIYDEDDDETIRDQFTQIYEATRLSDVVQLCYMPDMSYEKARLYNLMRGQEETSEYVFACIDTMEQVHIIHYDANGNRLMYTQGIGQNKFIQVSDKDDEDTIDEQFRLIFDNMNYYNDNPYLLGNYILPVILIYKDEYYMCSYLKNSLELNFTCVVKDTIKTITYYLDGTRVFSEIKVDLETKQDIFVVNATSTNGLYIIDKTYDEILDAVRTNKQIMLWTNDIAVGVPVEIQIDGNRLLFVFLAIDYMSFVYIYSNNAVEVLRNGLVDQEMTGNLNNLKTQEKSSIVGAINELVDNMGDVEAALDSIIAIQNTLIGGDNT